MPSVSVKMEIQAMKIFMIFVIALFLISCDLQKLDWDKFIEENGSDKDISDADSETVNDFDTEQPEKDNDIAEIDDEATIDEDINDVENDEELDGDIIDTDFADFDEAVLDDNVIDEDINDADPVNDVEADEDVLPVNPEMVTIPAGDFWMGCDEVSQTNCDSDEKPYHKIFLSSYAIDKFEVTAEDFKKCIDSGFCSNENMMQFNSFEDSVNCNAGAPGKEKHPVKCINWYGARRYCEWIGKRLPTEAEWEKAARGLDERIYPWGDEVPSCDYAVKLGDSGSGCDTGDTFEIGSKEIGKSYYGLYDMAGNVWEWVSDYYKSDYYSVSPIINPIGPYFESNKIMRGGGAASSNSDLLSYKRELVEPTSIAKYYGFRCAKSIDDIKKGAICTGQTNCYNDTVQSVCPTNGQDFYGQDVQYYLLGKCNQRSYTLFEIATDEIIVDDATGLQWQRELPESYSGCTVGEPAGLRCKWEEAVNYCETLNYGGYEDWRLPSINELASITNYGKNNPSIDLSVFPNIPSWPLWSTSVYYHDSDYAWNVWFEDGVSSANIKTSSYYVKCVRGETFPSKIFTEFTLAGKVVFSDSTTNLVWTKEIVSGKTWKDALSYCETLDYAGYTDWRLPNIYELRTLINNEKANPASDYSELNTDYSFWSSTTSVDNKNEAWEILPGSGNILKTFKTGSEGAICVRNGE